MTQYNRLMRNSLAGVLLAAIAGASSAYSQHVHFGDYPERFFHDPQALAVACAITAGDVDALDKCIASGANLNADGDDEANLLSWCMTVENKEAFAALLKAGAAPGYHAADQWDSAAARAMDGDMGIAWLELLLENGLDPNTRVRGGSMPLLFLAARDHSDAKIRLLIKHGADLNARGTECEETAASYAATMSSFAGVAVLLEAGADYRAKDKNDADVAVWTVTSHFGASKDRERVLDFLRARGVDLDAVAQKALAQKDLDVEWWEKEKTRKPGESSIDEESAPEEPEATGTQMYVELLPYYSPVGPVVNVGTFSGPLTTATVASIGGVAAQMQKEMNTLPVEAMFVLSIRLYDFGYEEEAVCWLIAGRYRARVFRKALVDQHIELGFPPFERRQAQSALYVLISEAINTFSIDKPAVWIKAHERVCAASHELPRFKDIYHDVEFVDMPELKKANDEVAEVYADLLRLAKKWHRN